MDGQGVWRWRTRVFDWACHASSEALGATWGCAQLLLFLVRMCAEVRRKVVQYLQAREQQFAPYVAEPFQDYLRRMGLVEVVTTSRSPAFSPPSISWRFSFESEPW